MNSIVLMGEVANRPESRETQEGMARSNFILRYAAAKPEDPEYQVQVVAFGNAAAEVSEQLVPGDQVVVEGRLQMNSITRPDGTREKRAEVVLRRFHTVGKPTSAPAAPVFQAPTPPAPTVPPPPKAVLPRTPRLPSSRPPVDLPPPTDDIPF